MSRDTLMNEIDTWVGKVRDAQHDPEAAHCLEDGLYVWFIRKLAAADVAPWSEYAEHVLQADDLEFDRWCA